jgi:hypothetical protein
MNFTTHIGTGSAAKENFRFSLYYAYEGVSKSFRTELITKYILKTKAFVEKQYKELKDKR